MCMACASNRQQSWTHFHTQCGWFVAWLSADKQLSCERTKLSLLDVDVRLLFVHWTICELHIPFVSRQSFELRAVIVCNAIGKRAVGCLESRLGCTKWCTCSWIWVDNDQLLWYNVCTFSVPLHIQSRPQVQTNADIQHVVWKCSCSRDYENDLSCTFEMLWNQTQSICFIETTSNFLPIVRLLVCANENGVDFVS